MRKTRGHTLFLYLLLKGTELTELSGNFSCAHLEILIFQKKGDWTLYPCFLAARGELVVLFKGAVSYILLLPQPTACSLAEGGPARPAKTTAHEEKKQAEEVFRGILLEVQD